MDRTPELVYDAKAALGECPTWDAERNVLYWIDVRQQKVHMLDPRTRRNRTVTLTQSVGSIALREGGGLVVASGHGFYSLDPETERLEELSVLNDARPNHILNDGKCDAAGRFWAGEKSLEKQPDGKLYVLGTERTVVPALSGIVLSNGICWSPDNRTMYYIDSGYKDVVSFDYDLESGAIRNRKVVVTFPKGAGFPDGMTIDEEGMLWIAHWDGFQVSRWNPATGRMLESIRVPAAKVTSCTFGGPHMDQLYITSSTIRSEDQGQPHYYAGGIFRIRTDVKGLPAMKYKG